MTKFKELQRELEQLLKKSNFERMEEIIKLTNPELHTVLGSDYFSIIHHSLQLAIKEGTIEVNDLTSFRLYFKQILRAHPGATFDSTSSLATSYLWNEREMKEAMRTFINNGGKIEQVFFVKGLEEMASPELETILDSLQKIGINIRIVSSTHVPAALKKYFFVEENKKIAWEIPIDDHGRAGTGMITTNALLMADFLRIFDNLCQSSQQLSYSP